MDGLDSKRHEELCTSIELVCQSRKDLERLARSALDIRLNTVVSEGNLRDSIFELVNWAESRGKLDQLANSLGNVPVQNSIGGDTTTQFKSERSLTVADTIRNDARTKLITVIHHTKIVIVSLLLMALTATAFYIAKSSKSTIKLDASDSPIHNRKNPLNRPFRVCIVEFFRRSGPDYAISEVIADQLQKNADTESTIQYHFVSKPIAPTTTVESIRMVRDSEKADLLLWGWYTSSATSTYVSFGFLIHPDVYLIHEQEMRASFTLPRSKVDAFAFHSRLAEVTKHISVLVSGLTQYKRQEFKRAIESFDQALVTPAKSSILPHSYLHLFRGVSYSALGDTSKSLVAYSSAIKSSPEFIEAYLNRIDIYIELNRLSDAESDLNRVRDRCLRTKSLADAWYDKRGALLRSQGRYEAAVTSHTRSISLNPERPIWYYNRANALLQLRRYREARSDLSKFIEKAAALKELVESSQYRIALTYILEDLHAEALTVLQTITTKNPAHLSAYYWSGICHRELGNLRKSLIEFSDALELAARSDKPVKRGMKIFQMTEDLSRFVVVGDINEDSVEQDQILVGMAISCFRLNEFELSERCYTQAIGHDRSNAGYYYGRGISRSMSGKHQAAIEDYTKAIMLRPGYTLAHNNRGNVRARLGEHKAALVDFDRAIAIDQRCAEAFSNRGGSLMKLGRSKEALLSFDQAIKIRPSYAEAVINRGMLHLIEGDDDAAARDFNVSLKLRIPEPMRVIVEHNLKSIKSRVNGGKEKGKVVDFGVL